MNQSAETAPRPRRLLCRVLGHRFAGWPKVRDPYAPLPWAHCGRCGRVL